MYVSVPRFTAVLDHTAFSLKFSSFRSDPLTAVYAAPFVALHSPKLFLRYCDVIKSQHYIAITLRTTLHILQTLGGIQKHFSLEK